MSALVVAPAFVSVAPGFELAILFCIEVKLGSLDSMKGLTTLPVKFCIRGFYEGLMEPWLVCKPVLSILATVEKRGPVFRTLGLATPP